MALYRTEGIILRNRNFGEADRIVTLYSPTHGKVRAVARGARRPRNRLVGSTQVFIYGDFLMFKGRNLDTISQAEIREAFGGLRANLVKTACASYIAELVDEMVEENEPGEALFALLLGSLQSLSESDDPNLVLRAFEIKLMKVLGYMPVLHACARCGGELGHGEMVGFSPGAGGLVCFRCLGEGVQAPRISWGVIETMRRLLEMNLKKVGVLALSGAVRRELRSSMRAYVAYRLEKTLKSLEFLDIVSG